MLDVIERYGYIVAMIVSTTVSTREGILLIAAFGGSQNPDWEKWKIKVDKNAEDMAFNARLLDKLFGFRHSAASARKCSEVLKQLVSEGPNDVLLFEIQSQIRTLEKTFLLDIENEKYFRVEDADKDCYERNQFDSSVTTIVPDAIYDMEEAGRCYALRRYTATALHLMRVAESGLKAITDHYGLTVTGRNWSSHLHAIQKHIELITDSKEKERMSKLHIRLDRFREAWRNPTMHIDRTYQREEAREVFDTVKLVMDSVAELLVAI